MQIGKINRLTVSDTLPFGYYLTAGDDEKVLLPTVAAGGKYNVGDELNVFIYHDSDDRLVASLEVPVAMLNQLAPMQVESLADFGAFVDWGLEKNLLVHQRAQHKPLSQGLTYVVYVYQDADTGRLAGSTRLRDFLPERNTGLAAGQPVELLIYDKSEMGYKAVISGQYLGLIFKDEVFKPLRVGDTTDGFVKRIREDGKVDLCLQQHNDNARKDLTEQILDDLVAHGGVSTLTDKSSPEEITRRFNVSKGAYKKALGALYKQKRILLEKDRITLIK